MLVDATSVPTSGALPASVRLKSEQITIETMMSSAEHPPIRQPQRHLAVEEDQQGKGALWRDHQV